MEQIERTIFVGPSLFGVALKPLAGEEWLGPARAGDIYRVARRKVPPRQIVLIDGVFFHDLAVWHKELLFAMSKGIVCIGSSSMGALRAAELHAYGMRGIGAVFERYLAGEEDDSLVAMSFDPETFRPLREAPLQQDKGADAVEAIRFARNFKGELNINWQWETSFERILERIK